MKALDALAISKKFTSDTAVSFGAVKGASCQIDSTNTVSEGIEIKFKWVNESGDTQYSTVTIPKGADGEDGKEISSLSIDESKHLIVKMSDDSTYDAGEVPVADEPKLKSDILVSESVGSATSGTRYSSGTDLETLLRAMLTKTTPPSVTFTLTPNTEIYNASTSTMSSIKFTYTVTRGSNALSNIKFYINDVMVNSSSVTSGGATYTYTYDTPVNVTQNYKVVVTDTESLSASAEKTVKFVYPVYYGTISNATEITESVIKSLKTFIDDADTHSCTFTYNAYGKCVYAVPVSDGELSSILDSDVNMNVIKSFTKNTMTVNGVSYYVYAQTDASEISGSKTLIMS